MIKKENTCLLIDIAIQKDSNVNTKETGKLASKKTWRINQQDDIY
jgi:hypothetical protein